MCGVGEDGRGDVVSFLVSELGETVEDNGLDVRVGLSSAHVVFEGFIVGFPGGVGVFSHAQEDVNAGLWLVTSRAAVARLFAPVMEGDANAAILGGMFGHPMSSRKFECLHGVIACVKVNMDEALWVQASNRLDCVGVDPVLKGVRVFNDRVQGGFVAVGEFGAVVPNGPAFVCNGMEWRGG